MTARVRARNTLHKRLSEGVEIQRSRQCHDIDSKCSSTRPTGPRRPTTSAPCWHLEAIEPLGREQLDRREPVFTMDQVLTDVMIAEWVVSTPSRHSFVSITVSEMA